VNDRKLVLSGENVTRRLRTRRSGVFLAELLLTMPVFMVFLLAVVQFGIFFGNSQVLALASRVGAEAASEITPLPVSNATEVPAAVVNAVTKHLTSAGIQGYCRIRLEHNANEIDEPDVYNSPEDDPCDCKPDAVLEEDEFPPYVYVRVTVCVSVSKLMPNLLTVFGLDISGYTEAASSTTIMRSERY
jgi:hypothetical protein